MNPLFPEQVSALWGTDVDFVFEAVSGIGGVSLGGGSQAGPFFRAEWADDTGGTAHHQRPVRNLFALGHKTARADQTLVPDFRAIENDGAHADECLIADGA